MLNNNYDQVIVVLIFFFFKNIFIVDHVYAWWWHRSVIIITISRLLQKKVFVTGAIHLNDFKTKFLCKKNIYKIAITLSLKFSTEIFFYLIINLKKYQITSNLKSFVLRSSLNEHSSSQLEKKIKTKIYIEKQPYKKAHILHNYLAFKVSVYQKGSV